MKVLAGAILRDAGEILLDGATADASTPLAAHRLGIRAVYQEFSLVPHLTVAENILLGQMPASRVPGCVDWGEAYRGPTKSSPRSASWASTCTRWSGS